MAVKTLDPLTVFHEPINIRAENVERIERHAETHGVNLKSEVFGTPERWKEYAIQSLKTVHQIANEIGLGDQLHLWPDKTLGSRRFVKSMQCPEAHLKWIHRCWNRISEWPE